jgi:hypothetical protein
MRACLSLTERDRELLDRLAEHEPLTTSELRLVFFSGESRCRRRLRALEGERLLTRVFPARGSRGGMSEALWFISAEGRRLLGAPARRPPGLSIPDLEHRRAVACFFCGLVEQSLSRPGEGLWSWLAERASGRALDGAVRPDGYGRYLHPGGEITFYLELDRGTEPHRRLHHKLAAYQRALASHEQVQLANVLVLLASRRRLRTVDEGSLRGPPWIWGSTDQQIFRLLGGPETRGFLELPAWPRDPSRPIGRCLGRRWQAQAAEPATAGSAA